MKPKKKACTIENFRKHTYPKKKKKKKSESKYTSIPSKHVTDNTWSFYVNQ